MGRDEGGGVKRAQAEDRRQQIQARLEAYLKGGFSAGGFGRQWDGFALVAADLYRNSDSDIKWLLVECNRLTINNSRLSRVEQALREALREALRKFGGVYNQTNDAAAAANAGAELAHDVELALSASPEAQPEEGR